MGPKPSERHLTAVVWRSSSYSSGAQDNCVEVADHIPGVVPVRDSKAAPGGPVVCVGDAAWAAFVRGVKGAGFRA